MTAGKYRKFAVNIFILLIYCLTIVCLAGWSLKNPSYNWDILPYMGVVLSYEKMDIKSIHNNVYATAQDEVSSVFYNRLIDPNNAYRSRVAQSPEIFRSQLPFYVVKPLYTRIAWLFYMAGISLSLSTVWPSVIAYFVTGLLLFFWLKKYWSGVYACIAGILIMLSPPLLSVAGLSTPDALSGLSLFSAVYFLTEKKSLAGTFIFLILAIFTRLDNIIPAICLMSGIFFTKKWVGKIPAGKKLVLFSLLLLSYFAVSSNAHSFGWSIFYYPVFAKQLNSSYTANNTFNFGEYAALAKSQVRTGLFFSFISLFFFLVAFLLWNASLFSFNKLTIEETFAAIFVLIILIRFILQPLIADRLYIPYYLSVIVFLVKKNSLVLRR
ncbi:MAG: hypothetical protein ABJB86_08535 [Bacteroidota bacterium]